MTDRLCSCGPRTEKPWHQRDTLLSPASAISGALLCAVVIGVTAYNDARAGLAAAVFILVMLVVIGLVAMVVLARRGHRGACLAQRAAYCSLAVPGLPVRAVLAIGMLFP